MNKFIYAMTDQYNTYGLYKGYANKINVDRIIYMYHFEDNQGRERYRVGVDMGIGTLPMDIKEEDYKALEKLEYGIK